jgi:hypothetical protein
MLEWFNSFPFDVTSPGPIQKSGSSNDPPLKLPYPRDTTDGGLDLNLTSPPMPEFVKFRWTCPIFPERKTDD